MALKLGHFGKQIRNTWKVSKWCWRRMKKISWTDSVKKEKVLHTVKEKRHILHTEQRRKANWIGHILASSCLLKHIIKGKTE
jgi:hypothetical protein